MPALSRLCTPLPSTNQHYPLKISGFTLHRILLIVIHISALVILLIKLIVPSTPQPSDTICLLVKLWSNVAFFFQIHAVCNHLPHVLCSWIAHFYCALLLISRRYLFLIPVEEQVRRVINVLCKLFKSFTFNILFHVAGSVFFKNLSEFSAAVFVSDQKTGVLRDFCLSLLWKIT